MKEKQLINLPIADIYPHPDNPRKDLGDLTELTESIKTQGVLQNLTVVTGHYEADGHYKSGYTVIIGHRRLAAAKKAGLETVPAVIADMTYEEQIATMMIENMQRNDLTVYEQAQGFNQLSILGWKDEDIAGKTGFSKKTIGKRLRIAKLAELNANEMKNAVGRGATIEDILEIEKLHDPERQEMMFEYLGTPDFNAALRRELNAEKFERIKRRWVSALEDAGAEKVTSMPEGTVYYFSLYSWNLNEEAPKLDENREYFYIDNAAQLTIYRKKPEEEEITEEQRAAEEKLRKRKERADRLYATAKLHYELRRDFIKKGEYADIKTEELLGIYCRALELSGYQGYARDQVDKLRSQFGINKDKEFNAAVLLDFERQPVKTFLTLISTLIDSQTESYFARDFSSNNIYDYQWSMNMKLYYMYSVLERLGYQMSEEEKQMQDGTHPDLKKEE